MISSTESDIYDEYKNTLLCDFANKFFNGADMIHGKHMKKILKITKIKIGFERFCCEMTSADDISEDDMKILTHIWCKCYETQEEYEFYIPFFESFLSHQKLHVEWSKKYGCKVLEKLFYSSHCDSLKEYQLIKEITNYI